MANIKSYNDRMVFYWLNGFALLFSVLILVLPIFIPKLHLTIPAVIKTVIGCACVYFGLTAYYKNGASSAIGIFMPILGYGLIFWATFSLIQG